ncbi:DUF2913 family protein [Vibrio parahaemolyticus]|uniref:DUF2913 family protein n=1 Tax=Vibrio parahaemolyticus TaxID=670 RepID=UPI00186976B5|nr:DUF2913 family protein [Vibrio parahaemolyticus]MBE4089904.1 DUF2913 family protein [Vibrio parahaemolyticus]MCQ9092003.1 DUF2913 family protein [Vibrio parahaemolyticus]
MQIKRDFDYYHNLHNLVTNALLHLLCTVAASHRHVPIKTRNEILIRYLKLKVTDKSLSNIKKDIKLMLSAARKRGGNLEKKLHELNEQASKAKLVGAERLYNLLVYIYDEEGIESRIFEEGKEAEPGILYMIEEHIEHGFNQDNKQVSPLSMLIQLERAPELINSINNHGLFLAEMKEWNAETYQAHILAHPVT